ncbi:MAG TPA: zinc ribbon domain-containing protein [Thermomicrobiales bacterium]|nr:zinc ribbon domain-containing protein [Thermomicrobiales bacterium]
MECPQCGHRNGPGDRFCSNCGTRLDGGASIPRQYEPPERSDGTPPPPPPTPREDIPEDPADPEWRMSPVPDAEPPKRRTWLWVLAGLIIFCVLLFCGFSLFVTSTDTGREWIDDLATRAAEVATPVD